MEEGENMRTNKKKTCSNSNRAGDKKKIDSIYSRIIKYGIPKTIIVDDGLSFYKVKK
ncbi:MAG: hypothetical protein J6M07_01255 [Ruminococcus sp.]|nr:hypothetical protein [Ruminococcus sp.]